MAKTDLTAARLRELLHYDPETGKFTWASRPTMRVFVGMPAGSVNFWGRLQIRVSGYIYYAHRLAWLYVHGEWPKNQIDHIDGDPLNNRITNLRDVPGMVNQQNKRVAAKRTSSGLLGAVWNPLNQSWRARIRSEGKTIEIGSFPTKELAHKAYVDAKRIHHKGCTI